MVIPWIFNKNFSLIIYLVILCHRRQHKTVIVFLCHFFRIVYNELFNEDFHFNNHYHHEFLDFTVLIHYSHIVPYLAIEKFQIFDVISLAFDNVSLPFDLNSSLFLSYGFISWDLLKILGSTMLCCFPVLGSSFLLRWSAFILHTLLSPGSLSDFFQTELGFTVISSITYFLLWYLSSYHYLSASLFFAWELYFGVRTLWNHLMGCLWGTDI